MGVDENGTPIANILGRDITETHEAQVRRENELKAVAAKDQILSDITKTLYSYNLTLNLESGKYSLIVGTGMNDFVKIFEATDDYETAYKKKLVYLAPENVSQFAALASLDSLRARTNANGFIGNLEYGAYTDYGEEWHEINVFINTEEDGTKIAKILGGCSGNTAQETETKAADGRIKGFCDICKERNVLHELILTDMGNSYPETSAVIEGLLENIEKKYSGKCKGIFMSNDTHANILLNILIINQI